LVLFLNFGPFHVSHKLRTERSAREQQYKLLPFHFCLHTTCTCCFCYALFA